MDMNIDFLRFTWKPDNIAMLAFDGGAQGVLTAFLGVFPEFSDDRLMLDHYISERYQHYDFCLHLSSGIALYYDACSVRNKGVNVFIPSMGLWVIKQLFGFDDFKLFLREVFSRGNVRFTRIDLAFDDFDYREDGHFYAEDFCKFNMDGCIVSSSRLKQGYVGLDEDTRMVTNGRRSATFYLGTRTTQGRVLRIYDKFEESRLKSKKYDDPTLFKDCVRYEFEFGSRYADTLIRSLWIDDDVPVSFATFVDGWFRIIEERIYDKDTDKCKELPAWRDFVESSLNPQVSRTDTSENVHQCFVTEKRPATIDNYMQWIRTTVVPVLSSCAIARQNMSWIGQYIIDYIKEQGLSLQKQQAIADYINVSFDSAASKFLKKFT